MKEATGELNMAAIVAISIGILSAFFFGFIWPILDLNFKKFENDSPLYDDDYDWLNDDKYWNDNLKTFNNMKKDDRER